MLNIDFNLFILSQKSIILLIKFLEIDIILESC